VGTANLVQDAYGFSKQKVFGPEVGLMGDVRPYAPQSGIVRSVMTKGGLATVGDILHGTVMSAPGIGVISGLYHRNPDEVGGAMPGTLLAAAGGGQLRMSGAGGAVVDFMADARPVSGSTGYLNSARLSRSELRAFAGEMNDIGVNFVIIKNGEKFVPATNVPLPRSVRGAFSPDTETVYLRKGATDFEAFHEGAHAKQYADLGYDAYKAQGRYARESHVFNEIYTNRHRFSYTERMDALRYIRDLRNDFRMGVIN